MTESKAPAPGTISWVDLTVGDAPGIRDFYAAVVGWAVSPVAMGGYTDFCMDAPGEGSSVAGVCHARGENAAIPPQWLIYIVVADLDASLAECLSRRGEIVDGPRSMGPEARFAVIRDPAGAVAALYQPGPGRIAGASGI